MDPQAPQGPWVPLDLLVPWASLGVLDMWENLAPKGTLVRRATGGRGCTNYARL